MKKLNIEKDHKFGRLKIVREVKGRKQKRRVECFCDCGQKVTTYLSDLRTGHTKSCGCLRTEKATTHGKTGTNLFNVWRSMRSRCDNPKEKNYNGRGITVCPEWSDFTVFERDMGGTYAKGLELDRVDNNGSYCLENCRWVKRKNNSRNRRTNRLIEYQGDIRCLIEWSEITGIHKDTLRKRLDRGWPIEKALNFNTKTGHH